MRDIELELHEVLLDLAPDTHDHEEQARIVAEAAAIYRRASQSGKTQRIASDKLHEARLADSLLQAMGCLADWDGETDERTMTYIDARGLSADKVVSYAARTLVSGTSNNFFDLDDSDLDPFINPVIHEADDYEIEDGEECHPSDNYQTPGRPRHRSDSQAH